MDYIPQRDVGASSSGTRSKPTRMNPQQEAHARAMVSKMGREELEDKYLRTQEENIILKRHARKQEEKIKRMATKLIRLVNDRKKMSAESGRSAKRTTRDVTLEETIENQQDTIRKIQKENELLKQKLHVAHQQLQTQGRRHTPYNHVQSRINTGIEKRQTGGMDRSRYGMQAKSPTHDGMAGQQAPALPRYGHSLLEEAREENRNMQNVILALQDQIASMEQEHNVLQDELRLKNVAHEDDVLRFKEHLNSTQKTTLNENIELIRLQREIKEKSAAFTSLEARYRELQDNNQDVRVHYDKVLHEMDALKSRLLEEENRNLNLQNQMKHGSTQHRKVAEYQQAIHDLEREMDILKEANDRLTNEAFSAQQDQKWHQLERKLRMQIAQLEAVIQSDVKDKDSVLVKIANERGLTGKMQDEQRRLHEECMRLRSDNQELRDRLRLLSSLDDAVDVTELEEALAIVRQRRHLAAERKRPDFLESLGDESKDVETLYSELQVQHADTIQELEKTREMLLMQHKINKDYQIEVESVSNKMEEMKREYEGKLEHFAQLLDARAARIKKLERQLHDVAYGTKQYKYKPEEDDELEDTTFDVTRLERGENLLEVNITKVTLSREALQAIDDREPSTFITFAFYDYELVSTPIIKSGSPRFDFTSQYIVKVDDLFLHHLQKDSTLIELHQAFGTEYRTMCACKIKLNQLLDRPQGKLHGTAIFTGVGDGGNYGTLDFWVRLRVPMDQAIRLYKERTKALGYLAANTAVTQRQLDSTETMQRQDDNYNQLEVQIMSCNHVLARRSGTQPNVYCVYKFYDFADHDTAIIPSSNNPHFDDRQVFPVQMSSDLDAYLKSEKLSIYVFDDTDPDIASYLGKATVDLIPLAHDKVIHAPFQLYKPDDSENGTVELSLRWKLRYVAPEPLMKIPSSPSESREKQQHMIPEKLISDTVPVAAKKRETSSKPQMEKPTATSTPRPKSPQRRTLDVEQAEPVFSKDEVTGPQPVEPIQPLPQPKARTLKPQKKDSRSEDEDSMLDYLKVPDEKHAKVINVRKPDTVPKRVADEEDWDEEEGDEDEELEEEEPSAQEDSALEESIEEEITAEEVSPEEIKDEEATDADDIETDTDSVVQFASPSGTLKKTNDIVRISVNSLALHPESWVWKDEDIQKLFVEYTFLGSVEETPVSLPKPKEANQEISYNFSNVVHVDAEKNEVKRSHLAAMILPNKDVESTISFVVVSEPTDEEKECDELGTATVDLNDILQSGQDVIETDLEIVDGTEVIGRLNVSVEALKALNSVVKEVHHLIGRQQEQ